jgi:serine/threonine-protein kinase
MPAPPSDSESTHPSAAPGFGCLEHAWRAWRPGEEPPAWQRFLPAANEPVAPEKAFYLVQTDIEFRVKAGLPALLAQPYFQHPRWQNPSPFDRADKAELVRWEYQQRWRNGQRVARADYLAAFPECAAELAELKPRWNCPACQQPSIAVEDESSQTLSCPRCAGRFAAAEVFRPADQVAGRPVRDLGGPTQVETAWRKGAGAAANQPQQSPQGKQRNSTPEQAGRYVLREEIARGGMGAVYHAHDPVLGRTLAVKILLDPLRVGPDAASRFLEEARLTGQLQHPGIPPLHDLGHLDDGRPFFVMKLIEGQTLAALLREPAPATPAVPDRFVAVFEHVCQTVAYAHSRGIIHRDLKPANIMVGAFGEVQVMDWGLAKAVGGAGPPTTLHSPLTTHQRTRAHADTEPGGVLGTPAFMAPEQARGEVERLDERCDVFGLGAILCAVLTGRPPFRGSSADTVLQQARRGELAEAQERLDWCGADAVLIGLAKKCLAADPGDRYANAGEVADAVGRYRQGVQEKLRRAELERERAQVQAREERRRRRVTLALAAALLVLLLGAGGAALWWQEQQSEQQARASRLNSHVAQALDVARGERRRLHARLADPNQVALLLNDLRPWTESLNRAWSSWQQARKIADGDPELLDGETRTRLEALETQLQADDADRETARGFDALRLGVFESTAPTAGSAAAARRYARFFAAKGWHADRRRRAQTAARLRRSAVRYVAAAALDLGAWAAFTQKPPDVRRAARWLALARRIDPDPWRDRFRQVRVWKEGKSARQVLTGLGPHRQPPQVVIVAAALLNRHGGDGTRLLRGTVLRRAGYFWLNFALAWETRDLEEKVRSFRAALALRPRSSPVLSNLGMALGMKGDLDAAAHLARAVELDPRNTAARHNLGQALYLLGDLPAAIAQYRRVLRQQPGNTETLNNLGAALVETGDLAGAVKHLKKALALRPDFAKACNNLGVALRKQGKFAPARDAFRRASELAKLQGQSIPEALRQLEECRRILQLVAREKLPVEDWRALGTGVRGQLTAALPLDISDTTGRRYRRAHAVRLEAGRSYQIDLTGNFDPLLRVEDALYQPLLANDSLRVGAARHARLVFTPLHEGVYRLVATSRPAQATGSYTLRVRPVAHRGKPTVFRQTLPKIKKDAQGRYYTLHTVRLVRDVPCTITLAGKGFLPHLRLYNAAITKLLAWNAGVTPDNGRVARLDFTPGETATYQLVVAHQTPGRTGAYRLRVETFLVSDQ